MTHPETLGSDHHGAEAESSSNLGGKKEVPSVQVGLRSLDFEHPCFCSKFRQTYHHTPQIHMIAIKIFDGPSRVCEKMVVLFLMFLSHLSIQVSFGLQAWESIILIPNTHACTHAHHSQHAAWISFHCMLGSCRVEFRRIHPILLNSIWKFCWGANRTDRNDDFASKRWGC